MIDFLRFYNEKLDDLILPVDSSPEYDVFRGMKKRCYLPKAKGYKYYGGRGIKVYDNWLGKNGFANFLKDVGPRPSYNHTLERIDGNKDYEPTNVRWATYHEQNINRSNNRKIPGVYKNGNGWQARLVIGGENVYIKTFKTEQEAIKARNLAELKYLLH